MLLWLLVLVLIRRQFVVFGAVLRLYTGTGGRGEQSQSLAERRRVRRTGQRIESGQVLQTRQGTHLVSQFAGGSFQGLLGVGSAPQFGISWWLLENAWNCSWWWYGDGGSG